MKKLYALLLAFALVFTLGTSVMADGNTYVMDYASILSTSEQADLEDLARDISEHYQVGVYILTVDSFENSHNALWNLTEDYYIQQNLGLGDDKAGVMLTLSMAEREFDILAYGYGNTVFTDYGKDQLEDEFLPEFGDDEWFDGFEDYLNACDEYLLAAENGEPIDTYTDRPREKNPIAYAGIALCVGAVVALIACLVMRSGMKSARIARAAGTYVVTEGGVRLHRKNDHFTHTSVIRRPLPQDNDSGKIGGGTTINAGGFSHRGGKF